MKGKQEPYNIADFKAKVVEALVGAKLKDALENDGTPEHAMIPIQNGERLGYIAEPALGVKGVEFHTAQLARARLTRTVLLLLMTTKKFGKFASRSMNGYRPIQKSKS